MRKYWLALVAGGLILAGCLCPLVVRDMHFTEGKFDSIREGMTQQEVETVLGFPAGDYRSERLRRWHEQPLIPTAIGKKTAGRPMTRQEEEERQKGFQDRSLDWLDNWHMIRVEFDEAGRVVRHYFYDTYRPHWQVPGLDWLVNKLDKR